MKRNRKKKIERESLGVVLQLAWGTQTTLMAFNWRWFGHPKGQTLRLFIFIFVILTL
jgi:hypothetical protein